MRNSLLIIFMVLLTSCSMSLDYRQYGIHKELPLGSKLELKQQVVIPKDKMYVYFQYGEVVPFKSFNTVKIYDPYCRLSLARENSEDVTISPASFTVTRITEWEDYHGAIPSSQPAMLASSDTRGLSLARLISSTDGYESNEKTVIMYATIISLHSDEQPAVKELVCGHWDFHNVVEPLSLAQIKTALGDLVEFKIATK